MAVFVRGADGGWLALYHGLFRALFSLYRV